MDDKDFFLYLATISPWSACIKFAYLCAVLYFLNKHFYLISMQIDFNL